MIFFVVVMMGGKEEDCDLEMVESFDEEIVEVSVDFVFVKSFIVFDGGVWFVFEKVFLEVVKVGKV